MESKLISPSARLGKQIECLTITKDYFEENNINSDKEKLLANGDRWEEQIALAQKMDSPYK